MNQTCHGATVRYSGRELLPHILKQRGIITWRPIAEDDTRVELVIQRLRSLRATRAVMDLHQIFVERARAFSRGDGGQVARPPSPAA